MNSTRVQRRASGFTMVEMLVVIGIIALLLAMLLPVLVAGKQRAKRVVCESQLRQIGIAFQSFAHDHNGKFPMRVPASDGGSLEFARGGNPTNSSTASAFRHFQALSATLQTPAILICPADTRTAANNFAALQNSNVSYFAAVTADYSQPMSVLAGDGNLAASAGFWQGGDGGKLTWTRQQHQFKGNVLFADGHVEEWADLGPSRLTSRTELILPSIAAKAKPMRPFATDDAARDDDATAGTNNPEPPVSSTNHARDLRLKNPTHTVTSASAHAVETTQTKGGVAATVETIHPDAASAPTATNPPSGRVIQQEEDDLTMSPFDRRMAKFLRHVIVGTYLLILLLFLLFAAYRIWRYLRDPERQRRRRRTRAD